MYLTILYFNTKDSEGLQQKSFGAPAGAHVIWYHLIPPPLLTFAYALYIFGELHCSEPVVGYICRFTRKRQLH